MRGRLDRAGRESGAVGWVLIGIIVGVILVIYLIVQLLQGVF